MALVNITLRLPVSVVDALVKGGEAQVRQAVALEAIVAKLNEPDPDPGDGGVTQEQIDEWAAALKDSNDKLAAAGQQPVPAPAARLSRSS